MRLRLRLRMGLRMRMRLWMHWTLVEKLNHWPSAQSSLKNDFFEADLSRPDNGLLDLMMFLGGRRHIHGIRFRE
jgi:hypothetical protein